MSRRPQWPYGNLTVHLQRASPLGCCCLWQTDPQTTTDGSGPWWHAAGGCNNHHSDSQLYTSPTPSSRHCWVFWWHHCSNQPAAHGCHGTIAAVFPHHPSLCLLHSMQRKQPPSAALGAQPAAEELEDLFRPEGLDSFTSVPMAIFTPTIPIVMQMSLQVPIPAGAPSFAHITPWILQPTMPRTLQMKSLHFITQLRPPLRVDPPVSWTSSFSCRRKWTWPWSNYLQRGPPWISAAESWN